MTKNRFAESALPLEQMDLLGNLKPHIFGFDKKGFLVSAEGKKSKTAGFDIDVHRSSSNGRDFNVSSVFHSKNKVLSPKGLLLEDNSYVMVWCADKLDGSGYGVFVQKFDNIHNEISDVKSVNSYKLSNQQYPVIVSLPGELLAIAWQSHSQEEKQYNNGIFLKIIDNELNFLTNEDILVNTHTENNQGSPAISVHGQNNIIVAWNSLRQDGSGYGIYAQRFNFKGSKIGPEIMVNTYTKGNQECPSITSNPEGRAVIVWQSELQDGSGYGIYAQRFDNEFNKLGTEFRVNNITASNQINPQISTFSKKTNTSNGIETKEGFVVVWQSYNQTSAYDIHAKFYTNNMAQSVEFTVNSYVDGNQEYPTVIYSNGEIAVAWQSFDREMYAYRIHTRILVDELSALEVDPIITKPTTIASVVTHPTNTTQATSAVTTAIETVTNISHNTTTINPSTVKLETQAVETTTPMPNETNLTTESSTNIPSETVTNTTVAPRTTLDSISTTDSTDTFHPTTQAEQSLNTSHPQSTLDTLTAIPELGEQNTTKNTSEVLHVVKAINTTNISVSTAITSIAPVGTKTSSILLNESSTLPINASDSGSIFTITSNVKEATIIAGSSSDLFIFEPSSDSIVFIANFGNNDLMNFSYITNATSYSQLNITSGSTHFHFLNNQTVVIKNKYPNELNDTNVALQRGASNPVISAIDKDHNNNNNNNSSVDNNSNNVYLIVGVTTGAALMVGGTIAGTIAAILIYRHKKAVSAAATKSVAAGTKIVQKVLENLPYGQEKDDDGIGVVNDSNHLTPDDISSPTSTTVDMISNIAASEGSLSIDMSGSIDGSGTSEIIG